MRIATYNIHGCVGTDGLLDPPRTLEVLRALRADVLALQEVPGTGWQGEPIGEWLAGELGMAAIMGPTLFRAGASFGNATLLREPAAEVRRHDLSEPGREPRGAVEVCLKRRGRRLRVLNTHLGLRRRERDRQLRRLAEILGDGGNEGPLLLAGDLNEWRRRAPALRELRELLPSCSRLRTFPTNMPLLQLDCICCSRPRIAERARTLNTPQVRQASDHLPVYLDLDLARLFPAEQ